jgi:hypothetical protein
MSQLEEIKIKLTRRAYAAGNVAIAVVILIMTRQLLRICILLCDDLVSQARHCTANHPRDRTMHPKATVSA